MPVLQIEAKRPSRAVIEINKNSGDFLTFSKDSSETFSIDINGLPATTSNQQYFYEVVNVGDIAADSDSIKKVVFSKEHAATLYAAYLTADETKTNDAVNYQTIELEDSDGNVIVSYAWTPVFTAGSTAPQSMGALDGTHKVLSSDDHVEMTFTKTSSGQAISGLTLILFYTLTE